jgi:hypothetical protein
MWLGPKLPPCEEITKIVSASFDRPLTVKERLQKRLHFLFCAFCRRYGRQIKVLRDFTRSGANAVEEGRRSPRPPEAAAPRSRVAPPPRP